MLYSCTGQEGDGFSELKPFEDADRYAGPKK
jgi:hypothetical protein